MPMKAMSRPRIPIANSVASDSIIHPPASLLKVSAVNMEVSNGRVTTAA